MLPKISGLDVVSPGMAAFFPVVLYFGFWIVGVVGFRFVVFDWFSDLAR